MIVKLFTYAHRLSNQGKKIAIIQNEASPVMGVEEALKLQVCKLHNITTHCLVVNLIYVMRKHSQTAMSELQGFRRHWIEGA